MASLRPQSPGERAAWRPTRAAGRAAVLVALLGALGVVLGRVDLVALAAPFVIGSTLAARARPRTSPEVTVQPRDVDPTPDATRGDAAEGDAAGKTAAGSSVGSAGGASGGGSERRALEEGRRLAEGDRVILDVRVTNRDDVGYDVALLTLPESEDVTLEQGGRTVALPVPAGRTATVPLPAGLRRWGRRTVRAASVRPVAAGGLLTGPGARSGRTVLRVYPYGSHFRATDAMPNATGIVGVHPSRRYGDGGELADIRRFAPGDRLRRIDWRTSLRAGELHVVQSYADSDAQLAVVLDVLHDAGSDPSVLDLTVRAAAGIAEHYATRGDRVKLVEYGGRGRTLRGGSGPRYRTLVHEWLLETASGERRFGPSEVPSGRALVPDRCLVVVLTPFLEERTVRLLASLARARHSVVAVDTLPPGLDASAAGRQGTWTATAFRLWSLQRRNTVDRLAEHGIPVVRWEGAGSLDQVLRQLSARTVRR